MDIDHEVSDLASMYSYSRRGFLKAGIGGAAGLAGAAVLAVSSERPRAASAQGSQSTHAGHATMPGVIGEIDHARNGFNPSDLLTDYDYGKVSTLPSGQTLCEYQFITQATTIEVAPGVTYPA